jgi:hypothetical protein
MQVRLPQGEYLITLPPLLARRGVLNKLSRHPTEMSPRRPLTPAQLNLLRLRRELTARRRWLWKNKRHLMEQAQAKATTRATEIRQGVNEYCLEVVRTWPARMTPKQLDEYLLIMPYTRKGKKRRMKRTSLIRRLRLLGLIAYVPKANTWHNLCQLPRSTSLPDMDSTHQP